MQTKRFDEFSFTFGSNMLTVSSIRDFPLNRDIKYMLKLNAGGNALACYSQVDYIRYGESEDMYNDDGVEFTPEDAILI